MRKVALVHHYLYKNRGGEKVLKNISELYPTAQIYTLFFKQNNVDPYFLSKKTISDFFMVLFLFYC